MLRQSHRIVLDIVARVLLPLLAVIAVAQRHGGDNLPELVPIAVAASAASIWRRHGHRGQSSSVTDQARDGE